MGCEGPPDARGHRTPSDADAHPHVNASANTRSDTSAGVVAMPSMRGRRARVSRKRPPAGERIRVAKILVKAA